MNALRTFFKDHWLLLIALILALTVWILWLWYGATLTQGSILKHLNTGPTLTQAPQKKGDFSGPATADSRSERERLFTELGQTGDAFGALNALLTAIAAAFVFWAGFLQHQTLNQARKEAEIERTHRQLQEFESLFFQLLQLSATVTERLERTVRSRKKLLDNTSNPTILRMGTRALDSFAHMIYESTLVAADAMPPETMKSLVDKFSKSVYDKSPSTFGPYFRLLYQTFKHIEKSSLLEDEKIRYANIARGQISEGAVLLLALNGLSQYGYKFVPLVEKFGLLEHLHPEYRDRYKTALLVGYRSRAFLGSEERAKAENEWVATPLKPENYFASN